MRWLAFLVLYVVSMQLFGLDEAEKAAIRAAAEQVERESNHGETTPSLQDVMGQMSVSETEALEDVTKHMDSRESIRVQLESITETTLGKDVVRETLQQMQGAGSTRTDPSVSQIYATKSMGLLWVFWATDAPGTDMLPNQIAEVARLYPDLPIYDQHLMRLTDWQDMLKHLSQLKDLLLYNDPAIPDEKEVESKRLLHLTATKRYIAATEMADSRRPGGYLLIEDIAPALAYRIERLPALVFISPTGLVHRVSGINPDRSIAAWIVGCLHWESENAEVIKQRQRMGAMKP